MEQFSLEKYLENPARKVVTRGGREVDIYYSPTSRIPLIGATTSDNEIHQYTKDGFQCDTFNQAKNDLFFADEEELTEFERFFIKCHCPIEPENLDKGRLKAELEQAKELLVLARNEICLTCKEYSRGYQEGLKLGKRDALKDLPKWKKTPSGIQGNGNFYPIYLVRVSNGHYFTTSCLSWDEGSMYIELSELEKLPKEE